MCTLTWSAVLEGGYDLFFNRDELNTRGAERSPRVETRDGVAFAAPRDGDRGGTWLLANAHGVTVALLNDYAVSWRPAGNAVSRGAVVLACATAATSEAVTAMIRQMPLENVGAFMVIALGADGGVRRLHWSGVQLEEATAEGPSFETSSSFTTEAVCAERRRRFEELGAGGIRLGREKQEAFHWMHDAANGAASVLMRRPDARTRSVTRVSVGAGRVEMRYQPVGPGNAAAVSEGEVLGFARL